MLELNKSNYIILKEISKNPGSPKKLAKKINSSISYVSQQLKLLEAKGYVEKQRVDQGEGGRKKSDVRIKYTLKKEEVKILLLGTPSTEILDVRPTPENIMLIDLIQQEETTRNVLLKLIFEEELLSSAEAIYIKNKTGKEIDLLIITDKLELFRADKSLKEITLDRKEYAIKFWSHTKKEITDGLKAKEEYFLNILKNLKRIYEKEKGLLERLQKDGKTA